MNVLYNIKSIRTSQKISQTDLAEYLGIAHTNYGRIERGITELTVDRLYKIAEYLKVPVAILLGIETSEIANQPNIDDKFGKEIEELERKKDVLDNIQISYLEIFYEHIEILKNDILNKNNTYLFGQEYLSAIDIKKEENRLKYLSFSLFLKKLEWYEIAFSLKIIVETKIVNLWERFKYINPLSFTLDDIKKYKKILSNTEISEDRLIIEMIKERGKNIKYDYLSGEIEGMIKLYEESLPNQAKMWTVPTDQIISHKNEMLHKHQIKIMQVNEQQQLNDLPTPVMPKLRADERKKIIDGILKELRKDITKPLND